MLLLTETTGTIDSQELQELLGMEGMYISSQIASTRNGE